jgi:hypothetical protein
MTYAAAKPNKNMTYAETGFFIQNTSFPISISVKKPGFLGPPEQKSRQKWWVWCIFSGAIPEDFSRHKTHPT